MTEQYRGFSTENLAEKMTTNRNKKGLVLVAVLWLVVVLTTIVATVGRTSRLDMKVRQIGTEELRCKWACRAGIETAVGILYEDPRDSDNLNDYWSDNDEDFNDIALEGCYFTVRVIDEASKLNVNVATREQLLGLPYMEKYIVDAIIDWRDQDENPSAEGVEGGYYENLPFRYKIRNGPFRTIRELLLVKNVTEGLFYGEDTNFNGQLDYNERDGDQSPPADDGDDELDEGWVAHLTCYSYDKNVDAYGNNRVNINEGDEGQLETSLGIRRPVARWIVQRRQNNQFQSIADLIDDNSPQKPPDNPSDDPDQAEPLDLQTFRSIADKITVSNDGQIPGRVNINTASKYVLAALLGGDDNADQLAESIVAYRNGLYGGMQSIADVMNVGSMNIATFKRIANYITTRSDVYSIRCVATADRGGYRGATMQTQTVVDRNSSPCEILYWYQGAGD